MSTVFERPEYRKALDELDGLCAEFRAAYARRDPNMTLFLAGRLVEACANVYNISPPAGLFRPADLFRAE